MKARSALAKPLLACIFVIAALNASAQKPKPSMAEVRAQMAQAQHLLDSIRKAIPQVLAQDTTLSDEAKAGAAGYIPKMPDLDKLGKDIDASMANIQKYNGQSRAAREAGVPKKSAASFSAVPNADRRAIIAFATAMLPGAIAKLRSYDPLAQQALDTLIAKDSSYTPQAHGMLLLSAGAPPSVAQYLICKGVLHDPDNPWAVNDLGIMFRGLGKPKEAAQCFRYAYSFNDTFLLIKCNLAWAVAYTGDFITAKKYFHEILSILPNYNSAWEGLGMIAYQEGDIATLFQCLSKEVKTIGAGGDGPSDEFTGFVDGVLQDEAVANMGKDASKGSETKNNTLSNDNGEDAGNQDEPPTAYAEPPNYEQTFGGMFPNSIDAIPPAAFQLEKFASQLKQKLAESAARVASARASLPPISPPSYTDDQGMKVTPASSQKYYSLFHATVTQFEARVSEVYRNFDAEEQKLITSIETEQLDMSKAYGEGVQKCAAYPQEKDRVECMRQLNCEYKAKSHGIVGANLGAVSGLWTKYEKRLLAQIDWYVAASTPYIKRVHNVQWNEYMNAIRQDGVRAAVLHSYQRWLPLLGSALSTFDIEIQKVEAVCFTALREIPANGPDPKDVKLKKLKTAPDYCDPKEDVSFSKGPLVMESTCEHTAVGISFGGSVGGEAGAGPLKGSGALTGKLGFALEHVISQRHKEDNYTNLYTTIEVGGEASLSGHGGIDKGSVHASADGTLKAEANAMLKAGWRFDDEGNYLGRVKTVDLSVGVSAEGSASGGIDGVGERSISGKTGIGAEYHGEVFAAVGSEYKVTKSSGGIKRQ